MFLLLKFNESMLDMIIILFTSKLNLIYIIYLNIKKVLKVNHSIRIKKAKLKTNFYFTIKKINQKTSSFSIPTKR